MSALPTLFGEDEATQRAGPPAADAMEVDQAQVPMDESGEWEAGSEDGEAGEEEEDLEEEGDDGEEGEEGEED